MTKYITPLIDINGNEVYDVNGQQIFVYWTEGIPVVSVSNVLISGDNKIGSELKLTYEFLSYEGIEDGSTYKWHRNGEEIPGANGLIYAVQHARKVKPFNPYIDMRAIQVMAQLYIYYYQTVKRDPRFKDQNYKYCIKYYNEVFKDIYKKTDKKNFDDIFSQTISEQAQNMVDILPEKTIYQFIEDLDSNK